SVFIYWILDLGETLPVMLCMQLFGGTYYITAMQQNLAIYAISCIVSKLTSFSLACLIKQASKKLLISFKLKYKIFLLICPIISFSIYSYWCNFIYEGEKTDYIFTLGLSISLFLINIINIKLLNWISEDAEENAKMSMVQEYLKNERKHISKLDERNSEIRKMSHDLRHHILTISALLSSGDSIEAQNYIRKLTNEVFHKTKLFDTGNTLIDSVIEEYNSQAVKNGIKVNFNISILENLPIDEISIVIILGNALENAIEYCSKEKISSFDVSIRSSDKFLMIEIINPLKETPRFKNGFFETGKADSFIHGIGIQSMRETVKSVNGDLSIECKDEKFVFSAILPLRQSNIIEQSDAFSG
ncbi:MAG: GHKL domain-containing protein, partial [Bacillota bacterium]|nr:GHKL domain-containing protein [Bacillota bacterium]